MQVDQIFPSKYLKAADLQGREPTVVIAKWDIETIGEDRKLVIYFQGKEKGMVCNRTNADRISMLHGNDTDSWIGKEITLFTDMVNFQGRQTNALRVKPPVKRGPAVDGRQSVITQHKGFATSTTQAADPDDEIPF